MTQLMKPKEAAEYLGKSVSWLAQSRCLGTIDAPDYIKVGKSVYYDRATLDRYLEERRRSVCKPKSAA